MELEKLLQAFADDVALTKKASFTMTYLKDATWQISFLNIEYPTKQFKALDPKTVVKEAHWWLKVNRRDATPTHQKYTL